MRGAPRSGKTAPEKQYNNKVNLNGKHIYPGFIALNSTLGLVEVDAVRASDDESEIGVFNPNIRSIIAYNAESKIIETHLIKIKANQYQSI